MLTNRITRNGIQGVNLLRLEYKISLLEWRAKSELVQTSTELHIMLYQIIMDDMVSTN